MFFGYLRIYCDILQIICDILRYIRLSEGQVTTWDILGLVGISCLRATALNREVDALRRARVPQHRYRQP